MTLKTRMYMSILYLLHKKMPLTLDNILSVAGMARNMAHTIVHTLEAPLVVNQYTTELKGEDMRIEALGLDRETKIPLTFVPAKSAQEPDLINGYLKVDAAKYEKLVLELIADLPTIDICSQWECIKQEGRYDNAISHDMMHRMAGLHPMIALNAIEHHYKPDASLYTYLFGDILRTANEWQPHLSQLTEALTDFVKQQHPGIRSIGFSTFSETREGDMAHWMHSEFIPERIKFFIRIDIPSNTWIIDVCDENGVKCLRVGVAKDLTDLARALDRIKSV